MNECILYMNVQTSLVNEYLKISGNVLKRTFTVWSPEVDFTTPDQAYSILVHAEYILHIV